MLRLGCVALGISFVIFRLGCLVCELSLGFLTWKLLLESFRLTSFCLELSHRILRLGHSALDLWRETFGPLGTPAPLAGGTLACNRGVAGFPGEPTDPCEAPRSLKTE